MRIALLFALVLLVGCSRVATGPAETSPVVELSVASADVQLGVARIVWSVREGGSGTFLVQRRLDGAPWKGLTYLPVDGQSRLVLEDVSVRPGARYSYRVRIAVEPEALYAGEVTLEVPVP